MGTPGTGKSCILALICFYIAINRGYPVLWHRKNEVSSVTYLFHNEMYYQWDDENSACYNALYFAMKGQNCWFCLDGLKQPTMQSCGLSNMFKILATSGKYDVGNDASNSIDMCLVPIWKKDDLQKYGVHSLKVTEADIDARYYVSGGSFY
ncbi:crinkler (CRN) family protein [Thraustotheca clavata]|uniref:Crinkler (CRN) family protein n=1 Tax=Thraustotheca clavata TaxID=74557 RepID=A0A1V9YW29_9STRA|nr:crinkler (CRN) family protein [Thraustotheca clavata]